MIKRRLARPAENSLSAEFEWASSAQSTLITSGAFRMRCQLQLKEAERIWDAEVVLVSVHNKMERTPITLYDIIFW